MRLLPSSGCFRRVLDSKSKGAFTPAVNPCTRLTFWMSKWHMYCGGLFRLAGYRPSAATKLCRICLR